FRCSTFPSSGRRKHAQGFFKNRKQGSDLTTCIQKLILVKESALQLRRTLFAYFLFLRDHSEDTVQCLLPLFYFLLTRLFLHIILMLVPITLFDKILLQQLVFLFGKFISICLPNVFSLRLIGFV